MVLRMVMVDIGILVSLASMGRMILARILFLFSIAHRIHIHIGIGIRIRFGGGGCSGRRGG